MPITNVNRSGNDSSNRTTFRPPWVKSAAEPTPPPAQPSWVKKKTTDAGSSAATDPPPSSTAGTKPATTTTQTKQSSGPSKTTTISSSKSPEPTPSKEAPKKTSTITKAPATAPAKKEVVPSPMNTPQKEVRLQSREVKVPVMSERRQSEQHAPLKPVLKKVAPPPSSSEEEETDDEEEEYTEEEVSEEEEAEQDDEMAEMERLIEEARKEAAKKSREDRMKKELAEKTKADKLMVKLKPVLKKTPTVEEIPKEKPKSFLETPKLRKVEKKADQILEKPAKPKLEMPALKKVVKKDSPVTVKAEPEWKNEAVLQPVKNVPPPPPPPPLNGAPPPPPPPPGMAVMEKKELSDKQRQTLDKLKTRPRRRPDWSEMMAEVEQGRKLKHVQCNDRSQPILTTKSMAKVDGQFVFETEKAEKQSDHNQLLKQIQFGIKLKPTKTNDRSRPDLAGLRKFRRQMTIEEQIKKSESRATMPADAPPDEDEEDEMDDIDRLRDDLQSTKQMLSQELRNKEAQERENKRLLAKIQNLEAELERERCKGGSGGGESTSSSSAATSSSGTKADEALVKSLKQEAAEAQKISKDLEKKYNAISEQLDSAKNDIEEKNRKIAALEKQLSQGPGGYGNRRQSEAIQRDSSPEPEPEVSESDEDEDEEKKAERKKRRAEREVKVMRHKLTRLKEKEMVAKQEREALKMVMKTQQLIMKEEKKKYKALQKEVNKMAKLMAEEAEDDDEDEEKPKEKEEESEESAEESEESESDDSGSEEESESESEDEDAAEEAKKSNLEPRVKRHEGMLAALKKSNLLHQANVDKIKDEINIQRDLSDQLQHDLDSVLSELG